MLKTLPPETDRGKAKKVCEECIKETAIEYKYKDGFFTPKMKGINFLELGRSKMITNPFTILLEWLYVQWKKIRFFFRRLNHWLFPRRDILWQGGLDSYITGRITFGQRHDDHIPIHNMKVEFWARTRLWQWRKLAAGFTDKDGYFRIPYTLREARNRWIYRTQFEIYQTSHIYFDDKKVDTRGKQVYKRIKSIFIPKGDLIGMGYDLNMIQFFYWEYRTDTHLPRAAFSDDGEKGPQNYSTGRFDAMVQQVIPIELTKVKHLDQIEFAPGSITLESIQKDYPENLTQCIERKLPGYTRGDVWLGERLMNGMNRGTFQPDENNPNHYWLKYYGICNYDHNDKYALPSTYVKFELDSDGLPLPIEIQLIGPLNAFDMDPWQKRIVKPSAGTDWLAAKRLVRVTGSVSTELDEHFTFTHLSTEQFAIAAYRNLRRNPIANLLLPHLKEVALINHAADKTILAGFFPNATALTYDGVIDRLTDMLGTMDWKGWKPMEPLSKAHSVAYADKEFWDLTVEYVNIFIDNHLEEIKEFWYEIYCFSNDFVAHTSRVFLSNVDIGKLPEKQKELAKNRLEYYKLQYCFDPNLPRKTVSGELKILTPITDSPEFDPAKPEDLQNLREVCQYIIMMATYMHTWINEHQYDSLGEILYSGGGLRFGDKKNGVMAPESDLSIAPDLTWATTQMFMANLLARTEYGFITRKEENDVNPLLRDLLLSKKDRFAELGVDINNIESRTNI